MGANDHGNIGDDRDAKLGLLRALRLWQTRAREADAKCDAMDKERELLVLALMEDSMQLFAYRDMVRLLEFQVSKLQKKQQVCWDCVQTEKGEGAEEADGGLTWIMALAFCFGISGFGSLGSKYYYL